MDQPDAVATLFDPDAGAQFLVPTLLAAFALLASGQLLLWLSRASFRLGFDPQRVLARQGRAARTLGALVLAFAIVRWTLGALPFSVGALLLLCILGVLAVTGTLQDIAGGFHSQLRLRLREGDRMRVGPHEGELRSVHWERFSLRKADGTSVYLQNRLLLRQPVEVHPARGAVPVTLRIGPAGDFDADQVRAVATLMPYRLPDTTLELAVVEGELQVRCCVWSEDAHAAATRRLQALARAEPSE